VTIQKHKRQCALLDHYGHTAAYTGADLDNRDGWSGSATADRCWASGNGWPEAMSCTAWSVHFRHATDPLAVRLMTELAAGEEAGGDIRGQQSAALLSFESMAVMDHWTTATWSSRSTTIHSRSRSGCAHPARWL
jgi:uncharacterized Ntn-hydrolase superfamily protein